MKVADFDAMLDAWREDYDFSKHHIVRGHIAARSSDEILRRLVVAVETRQARTRGDGLGGRVVVNRDLRDSGWWCYMWRNCHPPRRNRPWVFARMERGENIWLVVPNDEGVFHGAVEREGIRARIRCRCIWI